MTTSRISPAPVRPDPRDLAEGESLRFGVVLDGLPCEAFAVRHGGVLHAYVNRCRHQARPLDAGTGRFLDRDAGALVCVHHGARYAPDTGACLDGPCAGGRLTALALEERDGALWCVDVARPPAG